MGYPLREDFIERERKAREHEQLELWNDTPTPWRTRMEQDAFEIAFPDEERVEGDSVTVFMDYEPETEGWRYSSWTWESGSDSNFLIEVRWKYPYQKVSQFNPANKRGIGEQTKVETFEKKEALGFWLELMKRGSR